MPAFHLKFSYSYNFIINIDSDSTSPHSHDNDRHVNFFQWSWIIPESSGWHGNASNHHVASHVTIPVVSRDQMVLNCSYECNSMENRIIGYIR